MCATGELKNALYAVDPFKCVCVCRTVSLEKLLCRRWRKHSSAPHKSHATILRIHAFSIVLPLLLSISLLCPNTMYSVGALCRPDQFKNMEMKMRHSSRIRHRSSFILPFIRFSAFFFSRFVSCLLLFGFIAFSSVFRVVARSIRLNFIRTRRRKATQKPNTTI